MPGGAGGGTVAYQPPVDERSKIASCHACSPNGRQRTLRASAYGASSIASIWIGAPGVTSIGATCTTTACGASSAAAMRPAIINRIAIRFICASPVEVESETTGHAVVCERARLVRDAQRRIDPRQLAQADIADQPYAEILAHGLVGDLHAH